MLTLKTLESPTWCLLSKSTMGFQIGSHKKKSCLFCYTFPINLTSSESLRTLGSGKITPNFEFSECSWEARFVDNCKRFVEELQAARASGLSVYVLEKKSFSGAVPVSD